MLATDGETGRGQNKQTVFVYYVHKKRNERPMLEVSLLGVGTVLRLERDAWSMVKWLRQATNEYAPPPPSRASSASSFSSWRRPSAVG